MHFKNKIRINKPLFNINKLLIVKQIIHYNSKEEKAELNLNKKNISKIKNPSSKL